MASSTFAPAGAPIARSLALLALLVAGCSAGKGEEEGEETAPSIYEGTWNATLDDGTGTFTYVVGGTTVEKLWFSFSFESTSCRTTVSCPESGGCARPNEARVSGDDLSAARNGIAWYEVTGTFAGEGSASGDVLHDAEPCTVSASSTWTASRVQ